MLALASVFNLYLSRQISPTFFSKEAYGQKAALTMYCFWTVGQEQEHASSKEKDPQA